MYVPPCHPCTHLPLASRYLWKVYEAGKVNMLVQDLNVPMVDKDQKEDRKKVQCTGPKSWSTQTFVQVLVDYFIEDRHNHTYYAFTFFGCEFLNFVNVVVQMFFMDFFLGGEFTTYGSDVLQMTDQEQEDRNDPLSRVFPKVMMTTLTMMITVIISRSPSAPSTNSVLPAQCRNLTASVFCL